MYRYLSRPLPGLLLIAILAAGCGDDGTAPGFADLNATYAGSASCAPCHGEINAIWEESGHPYALIEVDGEAPVDKYTGLSAFPAGPVSPLVPILRVGAGGDLPVPRETCDLVPCPESSVQSTT
jgi:hypothetical protein